MFVFVKTSLGCVIKANSVASISIVKSLETTSPPVKVEMNVEPATSAVKS